MPSLLPFHWLWVSAGEIQGLLYVGKIITAPLATIVASGLRADKSVQAELT